MKNVADIYPLSPMQELMLLHTVSARDEDALFNQFCFLIAGELEPEAFAQAWQRVVERHPVLRSSFLWEDLKEPVQVVHKQVSLPVTHLDWRDRGAEQRALDLDAFRREDRENRFAPKQPPLMRLTVIRWTDGEVCIIWSSHHLLVDRWCVTTVLEDVFEIYQADREGRPAALAPTGRFRDYIGWVQAQSAEAAETFWRERLRGFEQPTLLARARTPESSDRDGSGVRAAEVHRVTLSPECAQAVRTFVRTHALTASTFLQGAWALVLCQLCRRHDVVFGAVVSGRPAELPGVESTVGSFINNLPVRVQVDPESQLVEWLRGLQSEQQRRTSFEHVSPVQIQAWSDLAPSHGLFDHLLVWLAPHQVQDRAGLTIRPWGGELTTAFPFTLAISDGTEFEIRAYRDRRRETLENVPVILRRLESTLERMVEAGPAALLRDLGLLPEVVSSPISTGTPGPSEIARERVGVVPGPANGVSRPAPTRTRPASTGTVPAPRAKSVSGGRELIEPELLAELVRNEWRDLLGLEEIPSGANFFDLGGNSLLAANLHARIAITTGLVVPLLSVFQVPTLEGMLKTLQTRDWPLIPNTVMAVRTRGTKEPLFCVASPEVNTVGYVMLARYLSPDRPVYVLQTPPTDSVPKRLAPDQLLELAAGYVAALESVSSTGRVHLLGMCSGAHIAVEMGRQLLDRGRTVGFLGLVNTWALFTRSRLYRVDLLRQRIRYYSKRLGAIMKLAPEERVARLRAIVNRKVAAPAPSLARTQQKAAGRGGGDPWLDEFGWANDKVVLPKYGGRITVLRIRKTQVGRIRRRDLGWGGQADAVEIVTLSSETHDAILRQPHVQSLARDVEQCLESASSSITA